MSDTLKVEQEIGLDAFDMLCKKDPNVQRHEAQVTIQFDLQALGKEGLAKLHQIETLMFELGVKFDTGTGGGWRDWEFDWSLKGPVRVLYRRPKDAPVQAS